MLHISKGTLDFLKEMDKAITSKPLISTGVQNSLIKTFNDIEANWEAHYKRVQKGMHSFENKLKAALSDPIPARYIGKPRPMLRKFPYMMPTIKHKGGGSTEGGQLRNSVYYSVGRIKHPNNTWDITVEYGAAHEHAEFTNEGKNSKRKVHWLHWADNVFATSGPSSAIHHSSKIPDIRKILLGYYGK